MRTSRSKCAPSSLRSCRQRATARAKSSPCGARGVCARYSKVTASGAIRPARAPASIDMLHTVMRCSIDRAAMVEPRYSRSEEHTSELQSLMRIPYAVFCLKKKKDTHITYQHGIPYYNYVTTRVSLICTVYT